MRILYVASDQLVPGRTGGSVHVLEVAKGLAARGHEVHAVVRRQHGLPEREESEGVTWHRVSWFPPHRFFRFRARQAVGELLERLRAQVVMERYYNFGGEGIEAARRSGVPALLEVNSPLLDHPGSLKAALDAAVLLRPMRRYRERLCRAAAALVSPLPEIVPEFARDKTATVSWGANVEAFQPGRRSEEARRALGIPEGSVAVVFSGSFRPWLGVHVLEEAARRLRERADIFFVFAGGRAAGEAHGYRGRHLGQVAYERMPEILASADIGVAPYDTSRLAQLSLGFYWSPLKIFEYMASGLPVVTIARFPLTEIVREGEEALHVREADGAALASAIERLAGEPALRARLGERARARVVDHYSWASHCRRLEEILMRIAA
jgi:glycosyltransferase involved in cell wall biosynthesis